MVTFLECRLQERHYYVDNLNWGNYFGGCRLKERHYCVDNFNWEDLLKEVLNLGGTIFAIETT